MIQKILLAAGGIPDHSALPKLSNQNWDHIVAVDHGGDWLARVEIPAQLLIGDLDSVSPEALSFHQAHGARISRFPSNKNESDLELALRSLPDEAGSEIHACGLWGGRFDHSCMNLLVFCRFARKGLITLRNGALLFLITGVSRVTTEIGWRPLSIDTQFDR